MLIGSAALCYHYKIFERLPEIIQNAEKAKSWMSDQLPHDPIFDSSVTLTDTKGRALECLILAKRGGQILVRRQTDAMEFLISLQNLSAEDQGRFSEVADYKAQLLSRGPAKAPSNRQARWHNSMDTALKEAQNSGLPIYLLFTGTDW